ncbi:aldehyde ferredoxin oxidoreductase family protein [Methanocella arvoryzae]|uniref:Tungsten-containing aldehyde:ferredoxin oxidoreductase n=1 Tax=Methanocella arvoryzae (strain DSM 22066 / NBRC 105507 / MRE50) TaxID=351160 RepID=Q0W0W8_METAR|nr:aldehyde ferredoxin oxidoreductase family protein [Methanocella arvoryzae]CAJ37975.1 putative tungsten-containing aldehyde:ferredoxin oxidoreductase [Methanocella arvoryzae MRE50]
MPGGYTGKLLRVDLTRGRFTIEKPDEATLRDYIGGEGLGIKYLYDEVPAACDPLGPDNRLIFMTGPVTGSLAPTSGRHCVTTKSPLTGCQVTSHAGGYWGTQLKLAGYDGIIVQGQSEAPVYLFIDDGEPQLYDAGNLWGRDVFQTDLLVKEELYDKKVSVTAIGPAGENLVRYASIQNDHQRSAARGGTGAVMGSKKLKAIAVRGTQSFYAADPDAYKASMDELLDSTYNNVISGSLLPKNGVTGIMDMVNKHGVLPTRNHQSGTFEHAHDISGQKMSGTMLTRTRGCYCCNIYCTRLINVPYGPYHGLRGKGPDYDATVAFGSQCGNGNLEAAAQANLWCDQYGLDAVTTGETIAWAMELYERGIIDRHDTRGLDLRFGNHEAMVAMVPKIATRMEFGAVLADGLAEAAKKIGKGSEQYVMAVKNMDLPGFEARGSKAMGLQYAVDNRGGDNLRPFGVMTECFGFRSKELNMPEQYDPLSEANKTQWLIPAQNYSVAVNSLICCMFTIIGYSVEPSQYARQLSAITGFSYDTDRLLLAGERIWNLQRAFNVREGFTRKDDRLPDRLTTEPAPSGPAAGSTVHLDPMLDAYYEARGWDRSGIPTMEKLRSLGLEHVSRDLNRAREEAGAPATA